MKRLLTATIVALAVPAVPATAQAALPPAGSGTLEVQGMAEQNQAQIAPQYGHYIGFRASWPGKLREPRVTLRCYQGGEFPVDMQWGSPSDTYLLAGPLWSGGAAECTAELLYRLSSNGTTEYKGNGVYTTVVLAKTTFPVAP